MLHVVMLCSCNNHNFYDNDQNLLALNWLKTLVWPSFVWQLCDIMGMPSASESYAFIFTVIWFYRIVQSALECYNVWKFHSIISAINCNKFGLGLKNLQISLCGGYLRLNLFFMLWSWLYVIVLRRRLVIVISRHLWCTSTMLVGVFWTQCMYCTIK